MVCVCARACAYMVMVGHAGKDLAQGLFSFKMLKEVIKCLCYVNTIVAYPKLLGS